MSTDPSDLSGIWAGGPGNDFLAGQVGNDLLNGGLGVDTCFQGTGDGLWANCEIPVPIPPEPPTLVIAYADANNNHVYDAGDVMIAKIVDTITDGVIGPNDTLKIGQYPTTPFAVTPAAIRNTFEDWRVKSHTVTSVDTNNDPCIVYVTSSGGSHEFWEYGDGCTHTTISTTSTRSTRPTSGTARTLATLTTSGTSSTLRASRCLSSTSTALARATTASSTSRSTSTPGRVPARTVKTRPVQGRVFGCPAGCPEVGGILEWYVSTRWTVVTSGATDPVGEECGPNSTVCHA